MTKWMISFLSIVALASMFSGCGSEGSSKASGGTTETPTVDEPTGEYEGSSVQGVRGLSSLPPVPSIPEN